MTLYKLFQTFFNEIPTTPVVGDESFIITPPCEWIRNAPVNIFSTLREGGTQFLCRITNSDNNVNSLSNVLINVIRSVVGDVNPYFGHNMDTHRVDMAWVSSGAGNLKVISSQVTEKSFRHLGATGISGTDKENFFLHDDRRVEVSLLGYGKSTALCFNYSPLSFSIPIAGQFNEVPS